MITTLMIVLAMIGLIMPLFWIFGTAGASTYLLLEKLGLYAKTPQIHFYPDLGYTMADGGEEVKEEEKKK